MYNKYQANIYIFEPVLGFYNQIKKRFLDNAKIHTYNYGLSDVNEKIDICIDNDASSTKITDIEMSESIQLKSIVEFIENNRIHKIDLIKINIEGGEFDLLPSLLDHEIITKVDNLQIQFHEFIENSETKRNNIRKQLEKTHELTYDYYFIWENWKIKK
ncbi:MAG: FkbM family methyltransferase [Psychromonas sp.]|nr:FkbM family methyltransferase [Psychromonas sp.]